MSYDINEYTDEQCFELLDLNNPSDRELEMKILQQMDKYENKSKRLYHFFEEMYDRFFDNGSEEDDGDNEDTLVEGFTTTDTGGVNIVQNDKQDNPQTGNPVQNTPGRPDGAVQGTVDIKKIDNTDIAKATTTNTRVVDYVKDKLNPVSRKTIFKTISIDSQFREDAQSTSATNFSVNLSENLTNVISMKLYSVQIPYTWYTINNNFGSNYFYLKGNSPGIDNGRHDIKVQIRSGTYTGPQLATAINTSISTLKTKSINDPQYGNIYDLSFGQTQVSYNTANTFNSKILFEFDLRKTFNETDYSLFFPYWTTPNIEGGAKSNSIPSFLGYNQNTYLPYIAYSDASANTGNVEYNMTSTSNIISIIQYTSTASYSENVNRTINETITITIEPPAIYTRTALVTLINTIIKANTKLDSVNSYFQYNQVTDVSNINYGKNRAEMGIKLNRATTQQIPNTKLVIVFPDESALVTPPIWTGSNSCFQFPSRTIELNDISSETQTSITNYDVSGGVSVQLKCIKPGYDISLNHFYTQIPRGTYIISEYIDTINQAFVEWRDLSNNNIVEAVGTNAIYDSSLALVNTYPSFNFNIEREFVESDYIIDLSQCIFSINQSNIFNFDASYGWNNIYNISRDISGAASYTITTSNRTIVLIPKYNPSVGNYLASPITILLTTGTFSSLTALFNSVNAVFNSSVMRGSTISSVSNQGGFTVTISFNISEKLTEKDYNAYFIDTSESIENQKSWNLNFGISSSLYDLSSSNPVVSTKSIFNNLITLTTINKNNQIIFRPTNSILSGGDDIVFEIPPGRYRRTELVNAINTLFASNPVTFGSYIAIKSNDISTIRVNINKIYSSADFRLVFYDIYSFVYCNVGVSNVRNVKWDTTLGWTLGFHTYTEYNLSEFGSLGSGQITANTFAEEYQNYSNNVYGKIVAIDSSPDPGDQTVSMPAQYINSKSTTDDRIAIIGDAVCNTYIYNYFLLVLDDFIQNHVSAGLITISSVESDIALPSYASRISYQCDPITGKKIAGIGTNNNFTNLTAKQLYSMNQIIDARRTSSVYTAGPYMRDTFGIIPLKLTGLQFGSTYMEFGGTLQNQDRKYYGPVNIKKLSIKLMNDKGDIVDLNGTNWSFTLICEILNDQT